MLSGYLEFRFLYRKYQYSYFSVEKIEMTENEISESGFSTLHDPCDGIAVVI